MSTKSPLYSAILAAQLEAPPLEKSKTVSIKTQGGTFSYAYCPLHEMLATLRPVFGAHGVAILFRTGIGEMSTLISCVLVHAESGETYEVTLPISLPEDPKQAGSKLSYFERYLLGLATGITAVDDDDGTVASEGTKAAARRRESPGNGGREQSSRKAAAVAWAQSALEERFGGTKPWDPVQKAQVVKDLFGSGKWADFLRLPEETIIDAMSRTAHPALKGASRFEYTMNLVEDGKRRPDDVDPAYWPQKLAAGACGIKGDSAPVGDEGEDDKPHDAAEDFAKYGPQSRHYSTSEVDD